MKFETIAAGGLIALFLPVLLSALPAKAAPGDNVSVQACARAGAEANCLVITGADGTVYNITSAKPKPPLDVMIQLRGTVADKLSACNQGLVLDSINWTPTQQKCTN